MNINELFEKIQNEFDDDDLKGELIIQGNVIIWSFNLSDDIDEFDYVEEDNDEHVFNYEAQSDEERLIEVYHEDVENIKLFFDELGEIDKWTFSDYEIVDEVILFKIF